MALHLAAFLGAARKADAEKLRAQWEAAGFPIDEFAFMLRRPSGLLLLPQVNAGPDASIVDTCMENPALFLLPNDELTVARIKMESPGGFNLRGLGEPLKQLRELLKDLFYRNRIERKRAELELIKDQLALMAKFPLSEMQKQQLALTVAENLEELAPAFKDRKLMLTDGATAQPEPEPLPEAKTIPKRRSRKTKD